MKFDHRGFRLLIVPSFFFFSHVRNQASFFEGVDVPTCRRGKMILGEVSSCFRPEPPASSVHMPDLLRTHTHTHRPPNPLFSFCVLVFVFLFPQLSLFVLRFICTYPQLAPAITQQGQWYRLLTPVFLHGSLTHLVVNSMSFSTAGPVVRSVEAEVHVRQCVRGIRM